MPAETTFDYYPEVEKELARQASMLATVGYYAKAGASAARAQAPEHTGDYKNSIEASVGLNEHGVATGRVSSDDFFAHGIEKGSVNNPAYAPLRRGVNAAGLSVRATNG